MNKYEEALQTLYSEWPLFISPEAAEAFKTLEELVKKTKGEEADG